MNNETISYPKVLIFSPQPFNYLTGFGITVSNLFKNWPSNCLACAYTQDLVADDSVCRNHFRIKMRRLRFIAMGRAAIPEDFKVWLEDFSPEIIYCAPNSLSDLICILIIHRLCKAKLVVHMLDDWPARLRFEGIAGYITMGWLSKYYLEQLFRKSSLRIAIGNELCDAYKERYGLEFIPFQNCPESELWVRNGKNNWQSSDSLRLIFTGAIYNPGNLQTLLQLSEAVGILNRKGGNVKLDIYTTADNLSQYKKMFISERNTDLFLLFPDQEKMAKLYGSADVLLLVLGFGKVDSIGEKYSMPTKLPAYMLSGTPIMACAPVGSALAKFIKNKNAGFLVSKVENIGELADDINRIYHDEVACKEVGMNARAVALRELSAEVIRPRFVEALLSTR